MPQLCTYVARVSDGLPLVASFAPSSSNLDEEKNQAKQILRKLISGYVQLLLLQLQLIVGRPLF